MLVQSFRRLSRRSLATDDEDAECHVDPSLDDVEARLDDVDLEEAFKAFYSGACTLFAGARTLCAYGTSSILKLNIRTMFLNILKLTGISRYRYEIW